MEENLNQQPEVQTKAFEITENSRRYLLSIGGWLKFFYIISIIAIVFMAILGFAYIFFGSTMIPDMGPEAGIAGIVVGLLLLLMDAFVVYLVHCLGKAANNIKESLPKKNELQLEEGFLYTKKFVKAYGIFTIVLLGIYALVIVVAIIASIIAVVTL